MGRLWQPKRVLVCTFVTLTLGITSAYVGSQISLKVQSRKCQTQPWGLETLCHAWLAPGAIWQGSTIGLYLGTLLGAIASILATTRTNTKKVNIKDELAENLGLFANELELTTTQRAVLQHFLILVMLKLAASGQNSEAEVATLSVEELQQLLAIAKRKQLLEHHLTSEQIAQLVEKISVYSQIPQVISHFTTATHVSSQARDN